MTTPIFEQGGYDYDFVQPPPERLICKICQCPCRDAQMTVCCGNAFCNSCLQKAGQVRTVINACPMCREIPFNTFPSKRDDREVKELRVYCTNKVKGCEWQGELNYINIHLGAGCQFEEVKCTIECGKMIERRYLTSHVETECPRRKVNCQYCHGRGEHEFIEGRHKEECPKLPLACPNKCEVGTVPREDMEAHRKECPLEMIQCEYHNVGCEVRMARKDQVKHKRDTMDGHLMMVTQKLLSTQDQLMSTQEQLSQMSEQNEMYKLQVDNLNVLLNYHMTSHMHQYTCGDETATSAAPVLISSKQADKSSSSHNVKIISESRHAIDLVARDIIFKSGDLDGQVCPVVIKMTELDKKKMDGTEWYSDPFYTHKNGYKMCLNVVTAGYGRGDGTHLSVFLHLMKGPHDDELRWPLRKRFQVKLLNQISDSEHSSKLITHSNTSTECANRVTDSEMASTGFGIQKFISNEDLHKNTTTCQHVKDDCIFFQITCFV